MTSDLIQCEYCDSKIKFEEAKICNSCRDGWCRSCSKINLEKCIKCNGKVCDDCKPETCPKNITYCKLCIHKYSFKFLD